MLRATKKSKKVLESIIKKANTKNYYNNNEIVAYTLLNWINVADKDAQEHEECLMYDNMENYKQRNCYYCVGGLCINKAFGESETILNTLSYKYHDIVTYTHCLDLNEAIIKDINKLIKILYKTK